MTELDSLLDETRELLACLPTSLRGMDQPQRIALGRALRSLRASLVALVVLDTTPAETMRRLMPVAEGRA